MTGQHFAQIPVEVLKSAACVTLTNYAFRVLVAIAAQYRGNNNGDLAMTRATAREFGIVSQGHLVSSLAALLKRGLIQKTRQGGKKPLGPCLYAVTWQPIDDLAGKIDSGVTFSAANTWAEWTLDPPADRSKANHRVRRRSTLGLRTELKSAKSGLAADQTEPSIGSARSPPSRISPEGCSAPQDATGPITGEHVTVSGSGSR